MSRGAMNMWALLCGLVVVLAAPPWVRGQVDPQEPEQATFDCGTLALYHLLRLEGRSADLVTIGSHLPAMPPAGYSMKELRDAARACGLRLSGLRLKDPARELDRPMIAFLKPGH